VLDFQNNSEGITFAFPDYYRSTLLAEETDPNKLHDFKTALDNAQVYSPEQVQKLVELFLAVPTGTSSTRFSMHASRCM
jgi:type I restriction enzyme R subunit